MTNTISRAIMITTKSYKQIVPKKEGAPLYSIENYERPSVAADCAVFGIDTVEAESSRFLPSKVLKILLVRRGEEPFAGRYSLPGGFLRRGETIEEAALRELEEEAGVHQPKLIQFGTYSKEGRDPRGWIVSCAFLALTKTVGLATAPGSDAASAEWFSFSFDEENKMITLTGQSGEIIIKTSGGTALENDLAFDHGQMIYDAFMQLRDEVIHHDIIFDLMPEMFAVSELKQPYETITGTSTSPQNFRRKMASKICSTGQFVPTAAHRTSELYRRK